LFDGVQEVLAKINMNNIEQSILSAYKHDTLLEIVNHFHLQHYFTHLTGLDNIYASSKVNLGKDLMKKLVNFNGNVLLIGDTVHDFDVAQEIGCDCILIAGGHQTKEKLEKCGVKVFDNLAGMMKNAAFRKNGFNI
jgi:phosphoglycolate phosphatase